MSHPSQDNRNKRGFNGSEFQGCNDPKFQHGGVFGGSFGILQ